MRGHCWQCLVTLLLWTRRQVPLTRCSRPSPVPSRYIRSRRLLSRASYLAPGRVGGFDRVFSTLVPGACLAPSALPSPSAQASKPVDLVVLRGVFCRASGTVTAVSVFGLGDQELCDFK